MSDQGTFSLVEIDARCGGKTWPAGEVLSNYMIRKYKGTDDLKGKKIVELGSGTGFVHFPRSRTNFQTGRVTIDLVVLIYSLAMAKEIDLDDGIIYITDQENMVDIMTANINLNHTISRIKACELDWHVLDDKYL